MALQGTLKDFSITEIIQLIGQQLKTGVLRVQRGKNLVEIYFFDGMIVHVYSNYRGKKDLIGEILVKAHLITEEQLERVLRIQKESLKYLGEILVELQLVTKEDIVKVISTQIYETIYDLFWWEDGNFYFDLKLVERYKKIPFALSTEQVLLNILRMVDEWSEIEKKLYSPHIVFRKTSGHEPPSLEALSPQAYLKEKLTSEQELVYNLVDGNRTVQEIIDRSLLGRYNASEILVNLLDMGLIETAGVRGPTLMEKVSVERLRGAAPFVAYGALLVLFFSVFFYLEPAALRFLCDSRIETVNLRKPSYFIQKTQFQRVQHAIEIYFLERGTYPARLEELVTAKLLDRDDLFYRKGISYQYERKDGRYSLKH